DVAHRVALVPGMVAQRHHVGAGGAQFVEMALGEAAAMAGVLAVDDDEVEAVIGDEAGQAVGDGIAAGPADDVSQKQQLHAAIRAKWRAPASVMMVSSGTSWASRGIASSSWAAKARPTRRGVFLSRASVRS